MTKAPENKTSTWPWLGTALIVAGTALCAHNLGCTPQALRFYVITAAALCLWIWGLYPESLVAVLTPVAYVLAGVGPARDILASWTSPIGWLVLGGLIMGHMMTSTGVGRRLALMALRHCGGSLDRLLWGILLAGFLLAPCVPTSMGKAAILGIILAGICGTLGLKAHSREASCLFLAGMTAVTVPKFIFYTAAIDAALLVELMRKAGMEVSWFSYMRVNALPGLLYAALCVLLLKFLFRPRTAPGLAEMVEKEYRALGPWGGQERKALVLLVCLAVGLATDSLHGVEAGWLMILMAGLCFLPGVRLLDTTCIPALPLQIVFYVVGSMSIGLAARAAGVDTTIAAALTPLLERCEGVQAFAAVYASGTALLMSLTSLPAVSTLTLPLTEAGMRVGGVGQTLPYVLLYGLDQCLMPYAFGPALYMFSLGYISIRHFLYFHIAKFVMAGIFVATVAYSIWTFMF